MANVDPAFRTIDSKTKKNVFQIWRIENMKVVPVPKEQYGNFYKGDSYIVLSMEIVKGSLKVDIHFWLGSETSKDEAGVAAFKTVELDDYLGGGPVQHREVEGHESKSFMNYFKAKGGIQYLEGGHASGFNHVERKFKHRLLHVKGKHHVRVSELEASQMQWAAMNHGDVFILDLGTVLFIWNGKEASNTEKMKGGMHARSLRDERGGKGKANIIIVEDGEEDSLPSDEKEMLNKYLPLSERSQIQSKEAGGADDAKDRKYIMKLYVCAEDKEQTLNISEVKPAPLSRKDLNSGDTYIVDQGSEGLWVWTGKNSSKQEKAGAMSFAVGFIKKKGLDPNTSVTKVVENAEPEDFKCLFREWPQPKVEGKVYNQNKIARTIQTKFDAASLHENRALASETQMFDDGRGRVEVWRVENFDLVPIEKRHMGQFFGGDCYVILYSYPYDDYSKFVIYYWQGGKSSQDERGTSALKAVELDDKLGGSAVQVRVVQGKEPAHFMAMFENKMTIFEGGKAGWTNGEKSSDGPGDTYMLQVRGNNLGTKAVQVELSAESLNSNDVFVIFTKKCLYIWSGKGSTGDEREMAKKIASNSPRKPEMVFEGSEKPDFWDVLGGKKEYSSDRRIQEEVSSHPARLFQVSNATGSIRVDEIPQFVQQDLVEEDVMILDAWDCIYIWIGKGANKTEKEEARNIAQEYLTTDPACRDPDTSIYIVKQGVEPPTFTGFFGVWDREIWSKGQSYAELKKQLGEGNEALTLVKADDVNGDASFDSVQKYSLEQLAVPSDELPTGVDPTCKEIHLSQEEFERIFKMTYDKFVTMSPWKQKEEKKKHGLF